MSDQPQSPKTTNALWGGRFDSAPSEIMQQINASIKFDKRLAFHDIAGSRAHADMLAAQGIITNSDRDAIQDGLKQIESEIRAGQLVEDPALEDIHMHIEARLAELIGDAAGRLHTARSRNDQVATDLRLWIRDAIDGLCTQITALRAALVDQAAAHVDTIMPGFTHLQTAQPVTLGHHLLAYVEMFSRDHGRFQDARNRVNESPLGAAALAGTSFPIDRHQTARELGFARPMANSLDAVSARDFVLEFLAAATIAAVNLSRLAEELVLWASPQFGFLTLSDRFSTGSSIMPQKRNPDAAELTRAKTGRILGNLTGLVTVLKALPLAYSKDMQEDKEATFDTLDSLQLCLGAMTGMIGDLKVDAARMEAAASAGFATATDLADWLVKTLGMPFRQAHHVTGQIVKLAEQHGCRLDQLKLDDLQSVEPAIDASVFGVLDVRQSVASRNSFGGTAPETVLAAIAAVRKSLS